jgi:2-C-methyl-D-erythritol 4-phosphate cytidylyltransferase
MNIAIILAGGSGTRFGSNIPKQFLRLAGKYIIEYTIETFEENRYIDEICIIANEEYFEKYEDIIKTNDYKKVKKIISGGKTRQDSSYAAIKEYQNIKCNLIFHDAVRPFVSNRIINDTIKALDKYNGVDVAISTADTIIEVENNLIKNIPNRDKLKRGQTPQAFKIETIKQSYEKYLNDNKKVSFTDDCGLVRYYLNENIYVVEGEETNIKITYPADLLFAEKIIQLKTTQIESNINLKNKVLVVFGGSSGIGKEIVTLAKQYGGIVYSFSKSNGYDLTNKSIIQQAFDLVIEKEKQIDYIINTAGILIKKELSQMNEEEIEEQLNINLKASIFIAKYSIKFLQKNSMILFFTSSSYTRGRGGYSIYSATKAGIVNLTQALSEELLQNGIKVNCINPARTLTPMRLKNFGEEPIESLLDAKYVALKSLEVLNSNITGQVIDIKKGL